MRGWFWPFPAVQSGMICQIELITTEMGKSDDKGDDFRHIFASYRSCYEPICSVFDSWSGDSGNIIIIKLILQTKYEN